MSVPAADRGATKVADRAVRRIAERAATEALAPGEVRTDRSTASVRGRRARVDVAVTLPYPAPLDESGERVRSHVAGRTARLTGLTVPSARVRVRELNVRAAEFGEPEAAESTGGVRARRPWSARRVPVAVAAVVAAAACGVLLYDVLSVHAAGRAPARWRADFTEWLVTHGPHRGVWPGAAAAFAVFCLGVWLMVLAVTPGSRGRLPMRPPLSGVHAVVDRGTVAALLREAVSGLPGITRARVRVGRRRVTVRAGLAFGEIDAARAALTETAERTLASCGTARPPRLRVGLRTEPAWRAPARGGVDG
ncbi:MULTISPECIES: DUF6286 domain-containing protein [Streptomyces]|uniref:DUF6286 domain-containing protein n=2 Tax=Streptomyces TaxID=1883 RepID=A0A5P2BJ93_STRVZ|nr:MULTISPECIES: DUF6286 domain-containing protein [Streptomyces]MYZ14844.1 Asp23/Gls24 family envelope stress response protein [Streptomyces sp. SID337]QES28439.1 hypothetical protein DEJ47_20150 [Streptomyces venezuelae]